MDKVKAKSEKWKRNLGARMGAVTSFVAVLLLLVSAVGGCGKSDEGISGESSGKAVNGTGGETCGKTDSGTGTSAIEKSEQVNTLVVKGLYIGQKVDDAFEACKKIATSSEDLIVVDFRNGIEVERVVGLGEYEKQQKDAWNLHHRKRRDAYRKGLSSKQIERMGLRVYTWEDWKKLHPPTAEEIAASKKKVKEIVSKKNLIQVSVKKKGVREDKLPGLVFVWIDDAGKVKEVYFNGDGMDRLFNAGDFSTKEFAQSLVKNYSGIPSLEPQVQREDPGRGTIQSTTWIYKDPKGYQVKLFERAYFNDSGVKYNGKMLERDVEVAMALSLVNKLPTKYFAISAIKPESARKFD